MYLLIFIFGYEIYDLANIKSDFISLIINVITLMYMFVITVMLGFDGTAIGYISYNTKIDKPSCAV